jgi:hypothetical protein
MNKVLKDPIAPKRKYEETLKEWSFNAPSYDNRTSCSMSAGMNYGVGYRTPVGKEKVSSMESGPIPQKSHSFSPDEIFTREDKKG